MKKPIHQRILTGLALIYAGFALLGTTLDSISNALQIVSPVLTYIGSTLLILLWLGCAVFVRVHPVTWVLPGGVLTRANRLGLKANCGFVGAVILLWIPRIVDAVKEPQNRSRPIAAHDSIPFTIHNAWPPEIPIWVVPECDIEILESVTPVQDSIVYRGRSRLAMPGVPLFGNRPQVDPGSTERGVVLMPRKFDLEKYMDLGFELRIGIHVGPLEQGLYDTHVLDQALLSTGFKFTAAPTTSGQ